MCGRYTVSSPGDLIAEIFRLEEAVDLEPRFNIAPTQLAPVVRASGPGGERRLDLLRWGLIPFWAKDPSIGNRMINARGETVASKPAFRSSFKKNRCLVLADGFFEWKKEDGAKQPYWLHRRDHRPFAFAGLWSRWENREEEETDAVAVIDTFTIITLSAHPGIAPIHERMPAILAPEDYDLWLDPKVEDKERLQSLLTEAGGDEITFYPVSRYVNSPANEGPRCTEPVD